MHLLRWSPLLAVLSLPAMAQTVDARQLVTLPEPAVATLRAEMRDNLVTLNEILTLVVSGKVKEAGAVAEKKLGTGAMGQHRDKPLEARPGPHMPAAMHALGMGQHKAASAFAVIAATGDQKKALEALPTLNAACVSCHLAYRVR